MRAAAVIAWLPLRGYRKPTLARNGSRPLTAAVTAALFPTLVAAAVARWLEERVHSDVFSPRHFLG
ncbi:hypothetical protein [Salinispora sp. H7-4]|uniref:hypothetical protein n=1 Tax=Salinispora sp. H7-4 TaxID=2748321 RepID=UPI0015D32429|nr:hypothetical protein [Salinispora sp. H7-4]NYT94522.1 hypothetical protein [Salinispora sp. H7-4]